MGDVVKFSPNRTKSNVAMSELFERFRKASIKAQTTLKIEDATEAGRAWRDWLESFKAIGE